MIFSRVTDKITGNISNCAKGIINRSATIFCRVINKTSDNSTNESISTGIRNSTAIFSAIVSKVCKYCVYNLTIRNSTTVMLCRVKDKISFDIFDSIVIIYRTTKTCGIIDEITGNISNCAIIVTNRSAVIFCRVIDEITGNISNCAIIVNNRSAP